MGQINRLRRKRKRRLARLKRLKAAQKMRASAPRRPAGTQA